MEVLLTIINWLIGNNYQDRFQTGTVEVSVAVKIPRCTRYFATVIHSFPLSWNVLSKIIDWLIDNDKRLPRLIPDWHGSSIDGCKNSIFCNCDSLVHCRDTFFSRLLIS